MPDSYGRRVRFNDIELTCGKTTYEMGQFCPNTKIIHSYFVFYYPDEQMIVDKTAEPVDKNEIYWEELGNN